jgi:hypothetical protein
VNTLLKLLYDAATYRNNNNNNNRGNWNHFHITQNIPEQNTGKAGNQGATDNSHIGHCTHTAESVDVKVENI